jgi:hypothetical protein
MKTDRLLLVTLFTALILTNAPTANAQEPAPPLGRLFYSPEWRNHLEHQRQLDIKETRTLAGSTMRLDGIVVRSSGKSTVWVNRQSQSEGASDSGVAVITSRQYPDRATLAPGGETPADLKVGQTINRATRETDGGLAAGEIRVRPAPAPGR